LDVGQNSRESLDLLFTVAYEELRRLAAQVHARDGSATLNTTALVNETWLKLVKQRSLAPDSALHFRRIVAHAMRQVLVDAARKRGSQKRDWGFEVPGEVLAAIPAMNPRPERSLLALDDALNRLAQVSERQASIVELRFFGGFEVPEIAAALNVSESTVMRDWRMARAWLGHALRSA
jgi:RNA polymerase sigma factor (TIGR02999 family)